MPRTVRQQPERSGKRTAGKLVSVSKLRRLREQAKEVRQQVAHDREQIAAEARQAVADAVRDGRLTKLTVVFRADEQNVLHALDRYRSQHGFKSRSQVVRAALSHLLNIDVNQPHWGWTAGRRRRS